MNMIKRLLLIASATALLVVPSGAQTAQGSNEMTIPEFRQVLVDLGTYLDAHKGTNLANQFSELSDDALGKIYPSVSNPLQLKTAVEALKKHDADVASGFAPASRASSASRASLTANAVAGSCAPGSIIDNSPGSACTPAYPDPTNTAWQNMVNPPRTFGAFNPTDYASVSSQACGLTVESNLVQVVAALNGTVTAAAIGCSALQAVPVVGVVAAGVCDVAVAVVAVAGAVSQGILADCFEQDADVNAAGIDASLRNTVTIFNDLNGINNQITNEFNAASTQLTNVNTQITGEFVGLSTQVANVDIHLTNVDNRIAAEFATLTTVVNQATAQLYADLKQVMKLEMTPEGLRKLNPAILTCTGTNCPNVLANCPAAGCSWNNVGPLP
jgi:hypothetical protein